MKNDVPHRKNEIARILVLPTYYIVTLLKPIYSSPAFLGIWEVKCYNWVKSVWQINHNCGIFALQTKPNAFFYANRPPYQSRNTGF